MKRKKGESTQQCKVFYHDLYGVREAKHKYLWENNINKVDWLELKPEKDYYFFTKKDFALQKKYVRGFKINEIFKLYTSGITTAKDEEFINANKKFKNLNEKILYRPFDIRNIYYDKSKIDRSRYNTMKHFINGKENLGLCFRRTTENSRTWQHIIITNTLVDGNLMSARSYVFLLYFYKENSNSENNNNSNDYFVKEDGKRDNFTKEFRQFIRAKYKGSYTPEQILGYIYAVLHSPTYRTKYLEFIKIDFPRVIFTENEDLFKELSAIGFDLTEHHLLKKSYADNICQMQGAGDNYKVEKVEYLPLNPPQEGGKAGQVWINKDRYFEPVPSDIWEFYIGGYQVLDKWLKERKKHEITLSGEDIQHFIKVVNVLGHTIKIMEKIDEITKDWL